MRVGARARRAGGGRGGGGGAGGVGGGSGGVGGGGRGDRGWGGARGGCFPGAAVGVGQSAGTGRAARLQPPRAFELGRGRRLDQLRGFLFAFRCVSSVSTGGRSRVSVSGLVGHATYAPRAARTPLRGGSRASLPFGAAPRRFRQLNRPGRRRRPVQRVRRVRASCARCSALSVSFALGAQVGIRRDQRGDLRLEIRDARPPAPRPPR